QLTVARLAAIDAIMTLCYIHDEIDRSDIVLQEQIADTIVIFLPGIIGGLQEIIIEGEIQNHKVTVMAIRAWGRIISLIMHDKEEIILSVEELMKTNNNYNTYLLGTSSHVRIFDENLKQDTRNQNWFETAAIKLGSSIQLLEKVRSHSHYKIRLELVESISLIFKNCFRNMKSNIMALIDHLISLSEDEHIDVSTKANDTLNTIKNENFMKNHNVRLINLLEEKFYSLLTRLPTIVRWSSDDEQLASLNQFAGYLKLLGEQNLPHVLSSQAHIRKLLLALVYIMEIDCNAISVLQTINVKDLDDPAYFYGSDSWKQFKFIKNNSCKEKVVDICKLLGQFGDFNVLADAILEFMSDAPSYRKELSLLLNWILVSVKNSSALHLYKEIVNFYTSEEMWYLPIEVTEVTSLTQAQSNIVHCCLLMEGLDCIANNLQREYDTYLLKTLYLIMERAGSGNSLISYIGIRTLEIIAKSQQHKTIGDLLRANVDYFSFHIIIKLRQMELDTGVLDVVEVVMKYSDLDFLPYLQGIVEDTLRQLSNPFQQKNIYCFLRIFYAFIVCIKMILKCEDVKVTKKDTQITNNCSETIIQSLLEYYNAKNIDKKLENNIEEETELDADLSKIDPSNKSNEDHTDIKEDKQEDKKLPTHIKIIIKIMKSCLNFLPLNDVQISLMAMQTLQTGLIMLVEWEDELLPIVHQLWHPLTDRFNDKNVIVINRAWQLLHVLASISNDFIRNRTLRDVLPSVSKFLIESSKESINKRSKNIYKFTQTYKLQYELLYTLGVVTRLLGLREQELWRILSDTQFYLSARQNPTLQVMLNEYMLYAHKCTNN
ncbi:Uncharacterized protein KIAA0406, partial [Harpegnathos saltator]